MFEHLIDAIATLSPAQWCQAFYLLASAIIVTLALMPTGIAGRILSYGPRSSARAHPDPVATAVGAKVKNQTTSTIEYLTSVITSYGQVPHAWFKHFYVMSLLCSCFWLAQYLAGEGLLFTISRAQSRRSIASSSPSMTLGQIGLVWALMVLQATRRLVEHSVYLKPSSSRMWFVAWLLGLAFYMVTSVAVWVEGSQSIAHSAGRLEVDDLQLPWRSIVFAFVFLNAWKKQLDYHMYLASLAKYTLPESGAFKHIVCPHYTCECVLYLALAIAAAPAGMLLNQTLACTLVFVVVNLGTTAQGTKSWYAARFGADKVEHKWKMIPFIF